MKKALVAAFLSYSFFVLVNNVLSYIFYAIAGGGPFRFMLSGYTCRILEGTRFPYEQLLYFASKLAIIVLAGWLVLGKEKDSIINLLLLNLAVFNFCGAVIVIGNKLLQRHLIPNVFCSDSIIYALGGRIIAGAYFLLPLILGLFGAASVLLYFKKFHFSTGDKVKYAGVMAAGILIPLLALNIIARVL